MTETNTDAVEKKTPRRLLIHGPTERGEFYIADCENNVWSGDRWIGFGVPKLFTRFRDATMEANALRETDA